MTQCPRCHYHHEYPYADGRVIHCESLECDSVFWTHQGISYKVPLLKTDIHSDKSGFTAATNQFETGWFEGKNHLFSRINKDFTCILYDEIQDEVFNIRTNENESNLEVLSFLNNRLEPFGLVTQRLSVREHPRGNDPFLIRRIDCDPLDFCFDFELEPYLNPQHQVRVDPRWVQWSNSFTNPLEDMGVKINGQMLKPEQRRTLQWMLMTPASLTIGALPTGYGKSRIMQVAANLLNHGARDGFNEHAGANGPMLIISPLIALRDDQRNRWDEFNGTLNEGITKLRCEFLTSTFDRRDEDILSKLRNGEIDVLCCAPDIFLETHSRKNKWLECFQTMSRPFSAMVIDEAHVVGDWGASIIPTFQLLPTIKNQLCFRNPDLRVLLLSATISVEEERELIHLFGEGLALFPEENGSHAIRITAPRLGLTFDVEVHAKLEEENNLRSDLIHEMRTKRARLPTRWRYKFPEIPFYASGARPPMILYTYRIAMAVQIRQELTAQGFTAIEYTGSSNSHQRRNALDRFQNNEVNWVVGTSAFGMGVDKDDVWIVGYYGLPDSVKDLYQSFGRAARKDDWRHRGHMKNGYCKAIIFGRQQSLTPNMKLPLTMERILRSFCDDSSSVLPNGYLILDLEHITLPVWSTETVSVVESEIEDFEGLSAEFGNHQLYQQLRTQRRNEDYARQISDLRSQSRSKKENIKLYLWALTCAQRSGLLEVAGIHPPILYTADGTDFTLQDSLLNGGYSRVMANLQMQKVRQGRTPQGQKRYIVLRMKKSELNYEILETSVLAGINLLRNRHDRGVEELQNFRREVQKAEICLRKLFATSYGSTQEDTNSCIEHLQKREYAMPCSVCIQRLERGDNPVEHIWSEPHHFDALFELRWPQSQQVVENVLFRRPKQNDTIGDDYNQRNTIAGPFLLDEGFNRDDCAGAGYEIFSDQNRIATFRFTAENEIFVDSDRGEGLPLRWVERGLGNRQAFDVVFRNGRFEINWIC